MNTPILVHVQLAKFSLGSVFSELSQLILWPAKIVIPGIRLSRAPFPAEFLDTIALHFWHFWSLCTYHLYHSGPQPDYVYKIQHTYAEANFDCGLKQYTGWKGCLLSENFAQLWSKGIHVHLWGIHMCGVSMSRAVSSRARGEQLTTRFCPKVFQSLLCIIYE